MEMYRQGDLLFIRNGKNPVGTLIKSKDILKSSVTGHAHRISVGDVYVNEDITWEDKGNFYLVIPEGGARLIHEEHKTIKLPEGNYEVRRQREVSGYVKD